MNPWEMNFSVEESPPKQSATESPQKPSKQLKPWEMDFSTTSRGKAPVEASRASSEPSIEEVFPKLLNAESKGKHTTASGDLVKSMAGAEGITQLMPTTAANPGFGIQGVKDRSEGEYLRVGKEYLSALYNKYKDWNKALAAYNAGVGNVEKATGKAERYGGDWRDYLPKKKETIPYIEKILGGNKQSSVFQGEQKFMGNTPYKKEDALSAVKGATETVGGFLPGTGEMLSIKDAAEGFKENDLLKLTLGAIGSVPGFGGVTKILKHSLVKKVESSIHTMGRQHPDFKSEAEKVFKLADSSNSVEFKDLKMVRIAEPDLGVEGEHAIMAFNKKGDVVGEMSFTFDPEFHPSVFVDEAYQRKGVATKMYDMARELGWNLTPEKGAVRTPHGAAFRKSYDKRVQEDSIKNLVEFLKKQGKTKEAEELAKLLEKPK